MGFFKRVFSPQPIRNNAAQFTVSLIRRLRIDSGCDAMESFSEAQANNKEFIGSLLGLIDFIASQRGEQTNETLPIVINELFGENADKAFDTIQNGITSAFFQDTIYNFEERLHTSNSPKNTELILRSLERFF